MLEIICPICGLVNGVSEHPWSADGFASQNICPCCGTHYGEDDWGETKNDRKNLFIVLRKRWISNGMNWWGDDGCDSDSRKPINWNPRQQLKNIPKEFLGEDEKY